MRWGDMGRKRSNPHTESCPMRIVEYAMGECMSQTESRITLWSRYRDGAEKVIIIPGEVTPGGRRKRDSWKFTVGSREYHSARSLLIDITHHPRARNWTLDRYFGLGKFAEPPLRTENVSLSILEIIDPSNALEVSPPVAIDPAALVTPLGIDLAKRGDEVAKLLFAGFGQQIRACGYDPDDVLQEVYAGILVRNRGKCPFDPRKASFGHYVHMVCECVMSNYHRKQNRIRGKEQVGAPGRDEAGDSGIVDVQDSYSAVQMSISVAGDPLDARAAEDLLKFMERSPKGMSPDAVLAAKILPMVQDGYGRSDIAETLGVGKAAVSRALGFLRRSVKAWLSMRT